MYANAVHVYNITPTPHPATEIIILRICTCTFCKLLDDITTYSDCYVLVKGSCSINSTSVVWERKECIATDCEWSSDIFELERE